MKSLMTTDPTCRDTLTVESENGLHLVPCSQIARVAGEFCGTVTLWKGDQQADAKSPIHIAALGAPQGTVLDVEAVGEGCEDVVARLRDLFAAGFPVEEEA